MPRAKDIAWKFVIRLEGEKWCCPYCETEYSGKVTRVKSHFLKHPNKGISPCKKVPEHISKLMDWLHNQVCNKEDIAWKFVDRLEDNKWRCHYCSGEFFGDLTGVKGHLLKVPIEGISICTQVPDHVRKLMLSLLDEVAEEEGREANSQSSTEPQSRDVPAQAEVAEKENREAKGQFSTEPQSRDMLPPATRLSPQSFECMEYLFTTAEGATDMANFTSDQQQGERQFHQSSTVPSLGQNSPAESISCSTMALAKVESYLLDPSYQPQCSIRSPYFEGAPMNDQRTPAEASSFQYDQLPAVGNSQHSQLQTLKDIDASIASQHTSDSHIIEATIVNSQVPEAATNIIGPSSSQAIEQGFSNREHAERHCIFRMLEQERIPGNVRAAPISTSHPPNVEGVTKFQFPQGVPHLTPQSRELMEEMVQEMQAADIAKPPFDAMSYCSAPSPPNSSFPNELLTSFIESFDLGTSNAQQYPGVPLPSLDRQLPDNILNELQGSILPDLIASDTQLSNMATINTPQHSSQPLQSDNQCGYGGLSPPRASMDIEPPIPSQPFNGPLIVESLNSTLQIPENIIYTMGPSTSEGMLKGAAGGASSFQCDRTTVLHSNEPLPSCNEEWGTETSSFPLRESMDMYPVTATHVDLQVLEGGANIAGPSSSQALMDMRQCIPSSSQTPNNAPLPPQIPPCGIGQIVPSSLPELDVNKSAPVTSHLKIGSNFEENGALKRKFKRLYSRGYDIRDELKYAASLSLKKPRIEVLNWLADVEKLKNDFPCTEAASEDCLPPHQQVDILMREAEDLMRHGNFPNGLFDARETKVIKFLEGKMVGKAFERNTTKILEYLIGNQVSRLGIYGMGGVGKTTIMVHIYNRLLEEANYDNVLWITVSQNFNTQKLQDDIWKALSSVPLQEKDVRKRAAMLSNCLTQRGKSIIIFDDVWERFDFKEVGIPIRVDEIKLVLTTRSFDVCRQMHCQEKIKIEPLSHIEAESLFLEELESEVALDLETKAVVKSVVKECAGLPLAVITMARSMQGVTDVFEWKNFLEKLRESDMGQTDMEKDVLMKLEFSYNRLGNHEVQQCFLSCALYPEDELLDKFELIEFFIDQGLIGGCGLNMREKQYDRGLTILNKLENVCLLEDHGSKMKMHDLIRDMALHIMSATSIVKSGKRLMWIPPEEYWTDALEKVSLMQNDIREFPLNMSPNCPKLSTFLLNGSLLEDVVIPDSFFKQLWGLKVLNLSGCQLIELPNSISDLVNLRALLLRGCSKLIRLLYLGKLRSLRKLDLWGCFRLEKLEGLEMLMNLRYLDLSWTRVERFPKGTLGGLLNLQYLKVKLVNREDITKLWALETLECYFEDVDGFNKCVRVIKHINPRYYELIVDQENLLFCVKVSGDASFKNCGRSVDIHNCSHAIVTVGRESSGICTLIPQDVQTLKMRFCVGTTNLSSMGPLENLEVLYIKQWENLRVFCGGQAEEVINIQDSPAPTPAPLLFPSLRVLKISQCPKLEYLFGHESKFYLPHLQEIEIYYCEEMVGIIAAVTSLPPPPLPPFPSLEVIFVEGCDKMKRVVESEWLPYFPNLKRITVKVCENMEKIIGGPPPYMPVEDISLEFLTILFCNNMRNLFPHEWLIHLRNLQSIRVHCCGGMVEMISRAEQGQEGSIMTPINNTPSSFRSSNFLPKLKCLQLFDLPQLKIICEGSISCDSMEYIDVYKCPELDKIPLQLQLRDIEDLPYIEMEDEEKWKTLIWDHTNAQAILQPFLHFRGSTCVLQGKSSHWH